MENTKRFDELIRGCVVILFTIAIYAQSPVYVRTMLGAIVTLPLYFLMKKKDMPIVEWLVGFLSVVTAISFIDMIAANTMKDHDFSLILNPTIVVYLLCAGGLFYVAKRCDTDRPFVDAVIWGLVLSPYAALLDNYGDSGHCEFVRFLAYIMILLGCLAVSYFYVHRNKWRAFPVKLMFMLRVLILFAAGCLIELSFDIDYSNYPHLLRHVLIVLLAFSLYLVFIYRNSSYRLVRSFLGTEFLHKFGSDTLIIVMVSNFIIYLTRRRRKRLCR